MSPLRSTSSESLSDIDVEEAVSPISIEETETSDKTIDESETTFLVISMILLNVTSKGSIAVFETLGSQILQYDYGLSVFFIGIIISIGGTIGTIQLLLFKSFYTKYFNDIELMLTGLFIMIISILILLSYESIPSSGRYITGVIIMYGYGYPIAHTAILGSFSKIQKTGKQATLMGWFATSGSIARVILPIISGYLNNSIQHSPFCVVLFMCSLSYIVIIQLKPLIYKYIITKQDIIDTNNNYYKQYIIKKLNILNIKQWNNFQIIIMIIIGIFSLLAIEFLSPLRSTNEPANDFSFELFD